MVFCFYTTWIFDYSQIGEQYDRKEWSITSQNQNLPGQTHPRWSYDTTVKDLRAFTDK